MTSDFRFYLNKQGIRGQKGEKGETGFSPSIVEEVNTLTDYRLKIINEFDEFVTDNLRGSDFFEVQDPNGTYLRYNPETGKAYTGMPDQATALAAGIARIANTDDMETFSEETIVTPALFADSLSNLITSPDGSIIISKNIDTSKTELIFNSSTLDAIRTEISGLRQDLSTESQTRLNADNQLQDAINAEHREREIQDASLQNQLNTKLEPSNIREGSNITITRNGNNITISSDAEPLPDNIVYTDDDKTIEAKKKFARGLTISDGSNRDYMLHIFALGTDGSYITPPSGKYLTIGGMGSNIVYQGNTQFNYNQPIMHKDAGDYKLLSQDTVEQGENITIEQTTNGIKISSTGGAGAIIDDNTPATDKVFSSSKTSDLVGELGNEVNSIAGRLNTLEGEVVVATNDRLGLVKPDGTTVTINEDGTISATGGGGGTTYTAGTGISISSDNKINVQRPLVDSLSSTNRTADDGTELVISNIKLPQSSTHYDMSGKKYMGQFVLEGSAAWGTPDDALVSFQTIKAGANINIAKNIQKGEITFSCTASAPEVDNVTIEVNSDGKLQTTVDINELQAKVEDLQLYKFPNATIIGTPTINNGQITDFSTTNYLQFPFEFKTEGRTWLLNGSFDTNSDVTTQQNIIDSLASVALAVRNGRLVLALSTNGTTFDLGEHISMSDIEPNTKYYYRLSFSGTQYLLSLSTDKQEYMPEAIVTSSTPIASKPMTISSSGHPYKGVLNMNDWNLTVANTLVWQGMDDVGIASRLDVNLNNITETGRQAIKDIAGGGGSSEEVEEALDLLNGGDSTLFSRFTNPFSLFDVRYSDHKLYNASWMISSGQLNDGEIYKGAYNRLLNIFNGIETVEGINVKAINDSTATDYDFKIDVANKKFKLPTKTKLAAGKAVVGNGMALGLTDGTNNFALNTAIVSGYSSFRPNGNNYRKESGNINPVYTDVVYDSAVGITTDSTKSGIETDTNGLYLYYFIGDYVTNANLVDIGRIQEELNSRIYVIDTWTQGTEGYRIWSDGYCEQWGRINNAGTISFVKTFKDKNYSIYTTLVGTNGAYLSRADVTVSKITTSSMFIEYQNLGIGGSGNFVSYIWKASGYLTEGEY